MANRHVKGSEQIARTLAHGAQSVSALERAIFWFQLLGQAEPSRGLTLIQGSSHPADVRNTRRLRERGRDAARLAALVDVLLESRRDENPSRPTTKISREIFAWHDWASFEIDVSEWVGAASRSILLEELAARADGSDGALALALISTLG